MFVGLDAGSFACPDPGCCDTADYRNADCADIVLPHEMQEVAANPKVCLVAPRCGGHLAFLEGNLFCLGGAWMDRAVMAFLQTCHGLHHHMQAPAGSQA